MAPTGVERNNMPKNTSGNRYAVLSNNSQEFPLISSTSNMKKRKSDSLNSPNNDLTKSLFFKDQPDDSMYVVMTRTDPDMTMSTISPFAIDKGIEGICGPVKKVSRMRNETLLIQTKNNKQAQKLLAAKSFGGIAKIAVTEHNTLNTCKGIISCFDLCACSDDEIKEGLKSQKVIEIERIKTMRNGVLTNTPHIILTFKANMLPETIKAGFIMLKVRLYVPNPLRCGNCYKFGHKKSVCKRQKLCRDCSEDFHEGQQCVQVTKCINCEGNHPATSKDCPRYIEEHQIQTIRVSDKISYNEAKSRFKANAPTVFPKSFSSLLANPTQVKSCGCSCSCKATPIITLPIQSNRENISIHSDKDQTNRQNTQSQNTNTKKNVVQANISTEQKLKEIKQTVEKYNKETEQMNLSNLDRIESENSDTEPMDTHALIAHFGQPNFPNNVQKSSSNQKTQFPNLTAPFQINKI